MSSAMASYGLTGASPTPKQIGSAMPVKSGQISKRHSAMKVSEHRTNRNVGGSALAATQPCVIRARPTTVGVSSAANLRTSTGGFKHEIRHNRGGLFDMTA